MNEVTIHSIRMRDIRPNSDNEDVQIGKPEIGDYVASFMMQNQGRNSLVKVQKDGCWLELRPFEPGFTQGVEWPCVFRTTLKVLFSTENQQQYTAAGTQPALDPAETDPMQPDAIYHKLVLVEVVADAGKQC